MNHDNHFAKDIAGSKNFSLDALHPRVVARAAVDSPLTLL